MIAYNKEWLDNNIALEQIENAFAENNISQEEKVAAEAQYETGFYTPNIFIRIGLVILSFIIVSFSFGLLALAFLTSSIDTERSAAILSIIVGISCYVALEGFIKTKHHYQSGVDDALLWMGAGFIVTGFNFLFGIGPLTSAILVSFTAIYCTLRFADRLMAVVAAVALLAVIFFSVVLIGSMAKFILPFVLMGVSVAIYFVSKKIAAVPSYQHYKDCLTVASIVGLVCTYLAGNYFVVREASVEYFQMSIPQNESIPFGWLFWVFTIAIPLLYIFFGIKKRDAVLIRVGLLLVAGIIFTVRYYYNVLPIEMSMIIGGVVMIAIAYVLIKYLKLPRAGFTAAAKSNNNATVNMEALIIAETLSGPRQPQSGTHFGGGDFGGGGASGGY